MISEIEYLRAKKTIEEYELQQRIELERLAIGDINLLQVLSTRAANCFMIYNQYFDDGEKIIYVSDLVKKIKKDGRTFKEVGRRRGNTYYLFLMSLRNFGYKSHDEVMKYIAPYL